MSTKESIQKANSIRTKLLLLIAKEQSQKRNQINKNLMMLNSKSVEEINEQYQINSFKITISDKIINGGKNLCMNYSSKKNPRSLVNSNNNEEEKLKEKFSNNKILRRSVILQSMPMPKEFDKILIKAKRKISQNKLYIESSLPDKKDNKDFNPEKLKMIEIQKNSISTLRNIANLLKDYNTCKKQIKRQKSVSIQIDNSQMKNEEEKNKRRATFYSSKGIPKIKNGNLLGRNSYFKGIDTKKSHNSSSKYIKDIIEIENKNKIKFSSASKNKPKINRNDDFNFIKEHNKDFREGYTVY